MKAVIWTRYGPPEVLEIKEVPTPTPDDNQVLIRIAATTVFVGDCEMRRSDFPVSFIIPLRLYLGVFKPRYQIPGQELAGEIIAVGKDVTLFKPGDVVFTPTDRRFGSYAEYICLPQTNPMALTPGNMTCEEAATVPVGGLNALCFVRKAQIKSGDKVLINGAAGSIGTFAVQLAKTLGAEVTAVDSGAKLAMLTSIGADHVIDYTLQDYTSNGKSYDVIMDVVGKSPYARTVNSLKPDGRFILCNSNLHTMLRALWTSASGNKKVIVALAKYLTDDLNFLKELIETGKIRTVIDRRYPLSQIVEAHRYTESGQKSGHVVIKVRSTHEATL